VTLARTILALALFAAACSAGAAAEPASRRVLYLGIDGTRFDALQAAATPTLDRLLAAGIHSDTCLILGDRYRKNDTISGPGWSTILTGVWADKHGVNDNSFKGKNYEAFPHFFARIKAQQPEARTVSLVTWAPIEDQIVSHADVRQKFMARGKDYAGADAEAAAEAVRQLADPALTCLFLYQGQVDEAGHAHGFHPSVAEYVAAIEAVDKNLADVLAALEARPTRAAEDWLVVVTSDHGGRGTNHTKGHDVPEILHSFLIVSGAAAARGTFAEPTYLVDAAATVLAHLGIEPDEAWRVDGVPRGLKPAR
jgi:predicted AlkP superfamily pyrophosphatase or phosphodiesterase